MISHSYIDQQPEIYRWTVEKGSLMVFEYYNHTDRSLNGFQPIACPGSSVIEFFVDQLIDWETSIFVKWDRLIHLFFPSLNPIRFSALGYSGNDSSILRQFQQNLAKHSRQRHLSYQVPIIILHININIIFLVTCFII